MESSSGDKLVSFRNGDEGAFRYYYDLYYNALCLFGLRMLKEEEVAEDIVQDVFVNLWKAREAIESTLHLKMYLYQSMRHRCLNYIRVKKLEEDYRMEYALLQFVRTAQKGLYIGNYEVLCGVAQRDRRHSSFLAECTRGCKNRYSTPCFVWV